MSLTVLHLDRVCPESVKLALLTDYVQLGGKLKVATQYASRLDLLDTRYSNMIAASKIQSFCAAKPVYNKTGPNKSASD